MQQSNTPSLRRIKGESTGNHACFHRNIRVVLACSGACFLCWCWLDCDFLGIAANWDGFVGVYLVCKQFIGALFQFLPVQRAKLPRIFFQVSLKSLWGYMKITWGISEPRYQKTTCHLVRHRSPVVTGQSSQLWITGMIGWCSLEKLAQAPAIFIVLENILKKYGFVWK